MPRVQFIVQTSVPVGIERTRQLLQETNRAPELRPTADGFEFQLSSPDKFELDARIVLEADGNGTKIQVLHLLVPSETAGDTNIVDMVRMVRGTTVTWLGDVARLAQHTTSPRALAAPRPQGRLAPPPSTPYTLHADISFVIGEPAEKLLAMLRVNLGAQVDSRHLTATIDHRIGAATIQQEVRMRRVRGGTALDIHAVRRSVTAAGTVIDVESSTEKLRDAVASYFSGLGTVTAIDRQPVLCPAEKSPTARRSGMARRGQWIGLGA